MQNAKLTKNAPTLIGLALALVLIILLNANYLNLAHTYPHTCINLEMEGNQYVFKRLGNLEDSCYGKLFQLQPGDVIIEVNGKPPGEHHTIQTYLALEQFQSFKIKRGAEQLTFRLDPKQSYSEYESLLNIYIQIACWIVAFALLFSRFRSSRFLALSFSIMAVAFMSLNASPLAEWSAGLLVGFATTTFFVSLNFFLIRMLEERGGARISDTWVRWLFVFALLGNMLDIYRLIFQQPFLIEYIRISQLSMFAIGALSTLFAITFYIVKYKKITKIKNILNLMLYGLFFSFAPFIFLFVLPRIILGRELVYFEPLVFTMLVFPGTLVYLMFARQLFDIHLFLQRLLYILILSLIPTILLVTTVVLFHDESISLQSGLTLSFCVLVGMAVFLYFIEKISGWLETLLFSHKVRLQQEFNRFINVAGTVKNLEELQDLLLQPLLRVIQVKGITLQWTRASEDKQLFVGEPFSAEQANLNITLMDRPDVQASLLISEKHSLTAFSRDERRMLNLLASTLSITLENLFLVQALAGKIDGLLQQTGESIRMSDGILLQKSLIHLQELERERLAEDLHDSVMQDLYFVRQKLQQEFSQELAETIEHLDSINTTLRQTCFELSPPVLRISGLIATIQELVQLEQSRVQHMIHFTHEQDELIEQFPFEEKRHLYRVIQELLNNARKHATATEVNIQLRADADFIYMMYTDNGNGFESFNEQQPGTLLQGTGIRQIENRFRHMHGTWEWKSEPGSGVQLLARVPRVL